MPVICPSPFIEARPPVWTPGYPLASFLYAHLPVYPIQGKVYAFPFENDDESERFARALTRETLFPGEAVCHLRRRPRRAGLARLVPGPSGVGWMAQPPARTLRRVDVIVFEKPE